MSPVRKIRWWSWAIPIPLAAALLYWSARGVEWRRVWMAVASARPGDLAAVAALAAFTFLLRAVRWRILLNAESSLSVGVVFRANMAGYLGNSFLPARAGEVLRSLLISRVSKLTNAYVLTTAVGERLSDVVAVILAAALAILAVDPKPAWLADLSRTMAAIAGAGALMLVLLPHSGGLIERVVVRLPVTERVRKFLLHTAGQVLLGVRAFHDWRRLAGFAGLTAAIWAGDALGVVVGARSLNLAIPFPVAILLLTAMALGSALPSTPGYVGIYQFAAVMVLGPFGIARDQALAYSVIAQVMGYAVVIALGVPAVYGTWRREPER